MLINNGCDNLEIAEMLKQHGSSTTSNSFLDRYYRCKNKVETVILNKPNLKSNEILSIICDISFYQFDYYETEHEQSYFQEILDFYDDFLTDEDRWECLLKINTESYFDSYAMKHYNEFRLFLKDKVFVVRDTESLDTLADFQFLLDHKIKNNFYKVRWISFYSSTSAWGLVRFFSADLLFLGDSNIPICRYCGEMWKNVDFSNRVSFLILKLKSRLITADEMKLLFSSIYSKFTDSWKNVLDELHFTDTMEDCETILDLFRNFSILYEFSFSNCFLSDFYNVYLRKKVASFPRCNDDFSDIYSLSYLQALNELEQTNYDVNRKSSLYLKCFQCFLKEFLKNFNDTLEFEDLKIVEILFRRILFHKNICDILNLHNRLMLWHYYKTEDFVEIEGYSLEDIKKYNAKNYLRLAKFYLQMSFNNEKLSFSNSSYYSPKCLELIPLLNMFGYDDAKKLVFVFHYMCIDTKCSLKEKDIEYFKKFMNVFLSNWTFFQNNPDKIEDFYVCYNFLVEQGGKITFDKILNCVYSIDYVLFPFNKCLGKELEKLNLVAKGDPLKEKIAGIRLYDEYRFRLKSTIPDVSLECSQISGKMVDLHAPEIISNGIGKYVLPNQTFASSCLTPAGKASSCLRHGAINENGRFFGVYYQEKIIAYSWVWRRGDVLAFDNIEVTKELIQLPNYQQILFDIYKQAALDIMEKTKKEKQGGIKLIIIGRNAIDVPNLKIDSLPNVQEYTTKLFQPTGAENLYMKDSESKQVILAGNYTENLNLEDVEAVYWYPREAVKKFRFPCTSSQQQLLQAISFDDAFYHNKRYYDTVSNYQYGYYNEDWFVGYLEDGSSDFFYRGNDERLFEEAKVYVKNFKDKMTSKVEIIESNEKWIERILDRNNILVNEEALNEYFEKANRSDFLVSSQDYYHIPHDITLFQHILADRAITSAFYGNHVGGHGANGNYFISVARYGSIAFQKYLNSKGFLLNHNICTFLECQLRGTISDTYLSDFSDFPYPIRMGMISGEEQVFKEIRLDDKLKAIYIRDDDLLELGQILYLTDLYNFDFPLIDTRCTRIVERDVVKKYIRIKS